AFVIQNSPAGASAVGNASFGPLIGCGGITPSAETTLQIYGSTSTDSGYFTNGAEPNGAPSTGSLNLASGNPIDVTITYNGSLITQSLVDTVTAASFSASYLANLPSIVGGATAYVGISAGNGSQEAATQEISNFQFASKSTSVASLSSSASTVASGTSVTFTATVASASGSGPTPTGTVTFNDGSNSLGTTTLINGTAVLPTTGLQTGANTITAVYSGDATYTASTSSPVTVNVGSGVLAGSTTTIGKSSGSILLGATETLTATVAPAASGPTPTGDVQFYNGSSPFGSEVLLQNGSAIYPTSSLPLGTDSITAHYLGDAIYAPSISTATTVVVAKAAANATVSASPTAITSGDSVLLTGKVLPAVSGGAIPTGTVTFIDKGTVTLGTAMLDGTGTATLSTITLPVGTDAITMTYPGDGNYNSAASTAANVQVNAGPFAPVITTPSVDESTPIGGTVTFNAAADGNPTPTIQWQISSDGTNFSDIPGATSDSYAFIPTAAQDQDKFRAVFTNSVAPTDSPAATLTVTSPPVVTVQPTSQNAVVGQSVTFTVAATGNPTPSIQWQSSTDGVNFSDIPGATSSSYTFTAQLSQNQNQFRAVLTNPAGSTNSSTVILALTSLSAANVTTGGGAGQPITVVYSGVSGAINVSTISASNLTVTGPNNQTLAATVFNVAVQGNVAVVTYLVAPPDGTWQPSDNGNYSVTVNSDAVTDVNGVGSVTAASSFTVDATTYLVVSISSSNTVAVTGNSESFVATISTAAGAPAPTGNVTFYSDGTAIGTAPVDADGTATLTGDSLDLGNHAITASYSGDSTYPAVLSATPMVQTVATPSQLTPVVSGRLPALVIAGQKTVITQTVNITNATTAFKGLVTLSVYLSTDVTINSSATLLPNTFSKIFNLKASGHAPFHLRLPGGFPADVPAGTYHMIVVLKDPSGAMSQSASATTVVVQPPRIDLAGVSIKTPAAEKPGKPLSATITITNNGNVPAHGPLLVIGYSSLSDTFDQTATEVKRITKTINIKPGKSTRIELTGIVLSSTAGSQFLIVKVDPNDVFGDVNLVNNVISSTPVAVG
ncbi:MAG TPA: Ig-like domain repeat protein, partial [Tepidisphaeraceae bacterium]|nr:Ig-like domain repeat protein [Tepidisphaeraceae bacterium]